MTRCVAHRPVPVPPSSHPTHSIFSFFFTPFSAFPPRHSSSHHFFDVCGSIVQSIERGGKPFRDVSSGEGIPLHFLVTHTTRRNGGFLIERATQRQQRERMTVVDQRNTKHIIFWLVCVWTPHVVSWKKRSR